MKRITALFSMVFLVLACQAAELGAKERDLARILQSMHFADLMRSVLQLGVDRNPQSPDAARLPNVIAMSDNQIISAAVPPLFDVFTPEEARQVADFWASDTIAAMTKLQIAGDPAPLEKLTPQQREDFMRFTRSAGGAASQRMAALLREQKFLEEVVGNLIGASEANRIFGQKPKNR